MTYTAVQDGGLQVPDGPTLARKAVVDPVVNGRLTGKVYYTGRCASLRPEP